MHLIVWCGPGKDQGGYEWHRSKENAICLASLVTVNPIPITISHLVFSISLGEFKNTQWNQCDYVSCQGKYQNTHIWLVSFLSHIFNLTADEWEAGKETVVGGWWWWCPKSFDPRSQIPVLFPREWTTTQVFISYQGGTQTRENEMCLVVPIIDLSLRKGLVCAGWLYNAPHISRWLFF